MLYEDNDGNVLMPDEVDELSEFEIVERGIHVLDEDGSWLNMMTDMIKSQALRDKVTNHEGQITRTMTDTNFRHGIEVSNKVIIRRQKGVI